MNEGDLKLLGFIREENNGDNNEETDATGGKYSGANINQRLMMAIEESDTGTVEFCTRNGADLNFQYGGNKITALHLATTIGVPDIVELLLKNGADANFADARGVAPLHLAAGIGFADIVELLVEAKANVNVQDLLRDNGGGHETPLHRAAAGGHFEALRKLVLAGSKVLHNQEN